jgi:deoxyribose-phosphate aldolase
VTLVMLEAIRDYFYETGVRIGMKPAGGIRTAKEALAYLVMLSETLGDAWLTPDLFRFGASTLANDVIMQIAKLTDGNYQAAEYFRCRRAGSKSRSFCFSRKESRPGALELPLAA